MEQCHIYVISRSPRVSIDPADVSLGGGVAEGIVQVAVGAEVQRHRFELSMPTEPSDLVWRSDWPHESFEIVTEAGELLTSGVCALLGPRATRWPDVARMQEILYVGQAFGSDGDLTAWDLLKNHETLQRILAAQDLDADLWVTMAEVTEVQLITPEAGATSVDEESERTQRVMRAVQDADFPYREAVALAEAGLVQGWQPAFNDPSKHSFPARTRVPLETVRGLDLSSLVVEWQSRQLPGAYWSVDLAPNWRFFFAYQVHSEPGREVFLTALPFEDTT